MSKTEDLREKLADLEHIQWQSWAKVRNPEHPLLNISYKDLTEEQKDQDRIWADQILKAIKDMDMEFVDREAKLPKCQIPFMTDYESKEYAEAYNGLVAALHQFYKDSQQGMVKANWNKTEEIEEAIAELERGTRANRSTNNQRLRIALKLGIEALKLALHNRNPDNPIYVGKLPGETKD